MIKVENSKLIDEYNYSDIDSTLTIKFLDSDEMYEYKNVLPTTFLEFSSAQSKGKYFLNTIKPNYDFTKQSINS